MNVSVKFDDRGLGAWTESLARLDKAEPAARILEPLVALVDSDDPATLRWKLWLLVRSGGFFRAGCRIVPRLFHSDGEVAMARRVLSECARNFKSDAMQALRDWKVADDLGRIGKVLRQPPGFAAGTRISGFGQGGR